MLKTVILALALVLMAATLPVSALTPDDCDAICEAQLCKEGYNRPKFTRCSKPSETSDKHYCRCVYYEKDGDGLVFRCIDSTGKVVSRVEGPNQCHVPCTSYQDDHHYPYGAKVACKQKETVPKRLL